jgi:nucleotide-binding universal stress UspA family protein
MPRRILVPIDGSRLAEVAIPVAVSLARAAKAQIRFVLVHEPEFSALPAFEMAVAVPAGPDQWRERVGSYLDEVLGRLELTDALRASACFLDGMAGPTLAKEIGTWRPDLVVLATHGRGPFSRFWLGSVADYLVRHVAVPLLLLKPNADRDWPPADLHLNSIVLGWDFSPLGEAILDPVADLARLVGATVELVHVVHPWVGPGPIDGPDYWDWSDTDELRKEAEGNLAGVANRLIRGGVSVRTRVEVGTSVPRTLVDLINNGPHDLIALTTHGSGGIRRALLGSVADKVIRGSDKPVLVLRPGL